MISFVSSLLSEEISASTFGSFETNFVNLKPPFFSHLVCDMTSLASEIVGRDWMQPST